MKELKTILESRLGNVLRNTGHGISILHSGDVVVFDDETRFVFIGKDLNDWFSTKTDNGRLVDIGGLSIDISHFDQNMCYKEYRMKAKEIVLTDFEKNKSQISDLFMDSRRRNLTPEMRFFEIITHACHAEKTIKI